jgi:hypothetical protein
MAIIMILAQLHPALWLSYRPEATLGSTTLVHLVISVQLGTIPPQCVSEFAKIAMEAKKTRLLTLRLVWLDTLRPDSIVLLIFCSAALD